MCWAMASAVASAAVRMVERARRDRDLIVLDMHQVSADHYTKLLGELVDVMVCVTDHDPQSREHLRSWLDEATYDGVRERGRYVPVLDANQVRLVFVEGVRLSKSQAAKTMSRRSCWTRQSIC